MGRVVEIPGNYLRAGWLKGTIHPFKRWLGNGIFVEPSIVLGFCLKTPGPGFGVVAFDGHPGNLRDGYPNKRFRFVKRGISLQIGFFLGSYMLN